MDTQVDQHVLPQSASSKNSQFQHQQQGQDLGQGQGQVHSTVNVNLEPTQKDSSIFKDYEDHNSSLIFGGNITNDDTELVPTIEDETIGDKTIEDITEADDDTISPFLKKLQEMINQEGQNNGIRTHSEYLKSYSCESSKDGGGNGNDDTQVLIQRHYHSDDNYNIESFNDTIQKQRSNSKLFIQDNIDTQDDQMGDTQIIRKPLPDTQIIRK